MRCVASDQNLRQQLIGVGRERVKDFSSPPQNGYVTIDADTPLDHLMERQQASEGAVVLTFEDGPRNHCEVVSPLLRRYGMKRATDHAFWSWSTSMV
jgi:peptidoglycan/xylan/chitin deacetylase (PgdA/CDA1 family)